MNLTENHKSQRNSRANICYHVNNTRSPDPGSINQYRDQSGSVRMSPGRHGTSPSFGLVQHAG